MKASNLAVFKSVASVIGNDQAEIELQKVIDCSGCFIINTEPSLGGAFTWGDSPQGHAFWSDVSVEIP